MALTAYLTQTKRLLQNPGAPTSLYSDADLTSWINTARGQLSGEADCIRSIVSLTLSSSTRIYAFPSSGLESGIKAVFNVRMITLVSGSGAIFLTPRPWEWFNRYLLSVATPASGSPTIWTQYKQGTSGNLYFDPIPNTTFTATLDTVCQPIDLVDDSTAEAIPYPWTDCVPYFAAYLALLSAQSQVRQADANRMFERYEEFVERARRMSVPRVLPSQYDQSVVFPTPVPQAVPQGAQS